MKVLVLCGGRSVEREISMESSRFVLEALSKAGHSTVTAVIGHDGVWTVDGGRATIDASSPRWLLMREGAEVPFDVLFPVLHGTFGEDGTVQGLCEMASWPCAGAGVMASAVGMNKIVLKRLAAGAGIPVVPWMELMRGAESPSPSAMLDSLGLPVFVKPARLGSSVGISRVDSESDLAGALELAFGHDELVLVEKAVPSPREIEIGVIGTGTAVHTTVPGEIEPGRSWYDFEAKYACKGSRLTIPASLDPETASEARDHAAAVFRLLGGRGFARVDFLLGDSGLFLNEINTIPGFTAISMFPKLWEASGLDSSGLMDAIISEALSRPAAGLWEER
ncbi:MAG TPA: D-alanine--D-alanine ligase family protein [Candidatus Fermentibacter daniensis]|nr:D-alanine--D-alanine ligase family protein [Candidatus Fermentibacter daniensis]